MSGDVLTLFGIKDSERVKAEQIASFWSTWSSENDEYTNTMNEVQEYIQAIDTSDTSNEDSGWNNSTHIPKLTQIRDILYANYQTGLFPNEQWLRWEGDNEAAEESKKREAIQGYMTNKVRNPEFRNVVNGLLLDYIDYGNAYATAEYVKYTREDMDGNEETIFEGPVPRRISPLDIVFNPVATTWADTPVIVRASMTEGDLKKLALDSTDVDFIAKIEQVLDIRTKAKSGHYSDADSDLMREIQLSGLGNLHAYLTGNIVEVLTFYGNYYDTETGELMINQKIMIADRMFLLEDTSNPSWVGKPIMHVGWRKRPGNLLGMSVLENLIGMQYRLNHLENMKADALDLNVYPPFKVKGNVPQFTYAPRSQIHIPDLDGSDVEALAPDLSAMSLDIEIQQLMDWMEEFAGAPKQTMGFRTPGEKTAFEVQQLMTSAGRVFQEKITNFEVQLLEPLLNLMLSEARNGLTGSDLARVASDLAEATTFTDITSTDIRASGKLRPVGARHFSEQAQLLKNLVGIMSSPLGPKLLPHMSGKDLYTILENAMGIEKWQLFSENAGIQEMADQQKLAREAQGRNDQVAGTEIE